MEEKLWTFSLSVSYKKGSWSEGWENQWRRSEIVNETRAKGA